MGFLEQRKLRRESERAAATELRQKGRDENLAKMSNPDSNVDEVALVIRWLLLPAASLWVGYIGFVYTSKALQGVVDPLPAFIMALSIPAFVQFVKIWGGKKALRAWHFKWYDRSEAEFWMWGAVGAVVAILFVWSLKISIWDVQDTAAENYVQSHTDSLNVMIAAATSGIDEQIKTLNGENAQAGTMKTKKGKIAWSGQTVKMNNSAAISNLNEQRQTIVNQVIADYKEKKLKTEKTGKVRGDFFQRFGGFGEGLEILFLLILGLVEAINRRQNAERLGIDLNETKQERVKKRVENAFQAQQTGQPQNNGSGRYEWENEGPRTPFGKHENLMPIQFKWDGYGHGSRTVPQPEDTVETVAQGFKTVAQDYGTAVMGCNQVLMSCRSKLLTDIPNFRNPEARASTVSKRINKALDECLAVMRNDDFRPSRDVGLKAYNYFKDALAKLEAVGFPYEQSGMFLSRLRNSLPVTLEQV